jgi:hypothetical protein
MNCIAIQDCQGRLPRQGRARRRRTPHGPQRPRRRGAGLHERGRAASAHPANERIHGIFTTAGDKPNIVPTAPAILVRAVQEPASLEPLKERVRSRASRPARRRRLLVFVPWSDTPYADMIDNGPMVESYVANAAHSAARCEDPRRCPRGGLHRHGQRELPGAVDPPDDQGRPARRGHPHRGVRHVTPAPNRSATACSTGPRRWR